MTTNKLFNGIIVFAILVPIIIYFWIVFKFSENIPFWDDYDAVLRFMTHYFERDFSAKLGLLFHHHNEHRIFVSRVISLMDYYLFGKVNFEHLIYIGNLFLVGIFFLLYKAFKNDIKANIRLFIPVAIILFQSQYLTNSVWAMASIQNFGVIFFSLLSLYLLHRQKLLPSLFIGTLAVLTSGGGFLVFPIGALYIWLNRKINKTFYIWCITSIVVIGLYFYGYKSNPDHPSIFYALSHPMSAIEYLGNFTGSYFKLWGRHVAWIFALIFFALSGFLILKKEYKKMPLIVYFLLFLILTACLTTLSRSGFGHDQAWTDRYRMYSALFVALAYLASLKLLSNRKSKQILFGVLLVICSVNNIKSFKKNYPKFENHQTRLKLSNAKPYYPHVDIAIKTLKRSENLGIYKLPNSKSNFSVEDIEITSTKNSDQIEYTFDIDDSGQCYFIDNGWAFLKSTHDATDDSVYIVLSAKNNHHLFRTYQIYRPDVSRHFKKELDYSGFHSAIPKNKIGHKKYEVGILIISEGKDYYQKTNKTIQRKRATKDKNKLNKPPQ